MPPAIHSRIMRSARAGIFVGEAISRGSVAAKAPKAATPETRRKCRREGPDLMSRAIRCSSRFIGASLIKILEIRMHKEAPQKVLQRRRLESRLLLPAGDEELARDFNLFRAGFATEQLEVEAMNGFVHTLQRH